MVSYMGWGGGGGCTRTGVQLWVEFHEGAINHILTQSIQLSLSGVCVCVCVCVCRALECDLISQGCD